MGTTEREAGAATGGEVGGEAGKRARQRVTGRDSRRQDATAGDRAGNRGTGEVGGAAAMGQRTTGRAVGRERQACLGVGRTLDMTSAVSRKSWQRRMLGARARKSSMRRTPML